MTDSADSLSLVVNDPRAMQVLCGEQGAHLKTIRRALGATVHARGDTLRISGDNAGRALHCLEQLILLLDKGYPLDAQDVSHAARLCRDEEDPPVADYFLDTVVTRSNRRGVAPRSRAQLNYLQAIRQADVVFGVGPAGTGKTYLAVAMAVAMLNDRAVRRIVLVRPAVEAGERLGFLPGDLQQKVDPYLRPLFDALRDTMGQERTNRRLASGEIEIAPLAFMRGRTLNNAFVILDEAQNSTRAQMKMFLTRLGFGSKAVITGDLTQIDLAKRSMSGLLEAQRILSDIPEIRFSYFSDRDVVRHHLVQNIIKAYDQDDRRREAARKARAASQDSDAPSLEDEQPLHAVDEGGSS